MEFIAKNTNISVPQLHSYFEDDEAACLVMEFVEGATIDQFDTQ
jgi:hypothetical protein